MSNNVTKSVWRLSFEIAITAIILYAVNTVGNIFLPKKVNNVVIQYDSTSIANTTSIGDTSNIAVKITGLDTVYVPKYTTFHHWDTVPATPADTQAIIKKWLSTATYQTQEIHDSELYIRIEDTIYQNTITWRKVDRRILRPTVIQNITQHPEPAVKILVGGQLALNPHALGLIPSLLVVDRKCRAFSLGIDAMPQPYNQSRTIYIGMYYPIKK